MIPDQTTTATIANALNARTRPTSLPSSPLNYATIGGGENVGLTHDCAYGVTNLLASARRIEPMPSQRIQSIRELPLNHLAAGIGGIRPSAFHSRDPHWLRRLEPQPLKRHARCHGYVLNRVAVGRRRKHGVGDGGIAA